MCFSVTETGKSRLYWWRESVSLAGVEDVSLRSQGFIANHRLHEQIDIPACLM